MFQTALLDYVPKRFLGRATFEQLIANYAMLSVRDGRTAHCWW